MNLVPENTDQIVYFKYLSLRILIFIVKYSDFSKSSQNLEKPNPSYCNCFEYWKIS